MRYSTEHPQCSVMLLEGGVGVGEEEAPEGGDACIHIDDSRGCTAETNITF